MGRTFRWMVVFLFVALLTAGCPPMPPANPGHVDLAHRRPHDFNVNLQIVSGWPQGVGAVVHYDPYLTPQFSVPMTLGGGWPGFAAGRLGVRYRVGNCAAFGAGVGPTFFVLSSIGGAFDLDLAVGGRGRRFGFSFAVRPAISVGPQGNEYVEDHRMFYTVGELSAAFFVNKTWAITIHGGGAIGIPFGAPQAVYGGGGCGVGFLTLL